MGFTMSKKEKSSSKNKRKSTKKILERDLETLKNDLLNLLKHNRLADDVHFLKKIAHDIKTLNDDTTFAESNKKLKTPAQLIHHLISTPWGAPFTFRKTLLESAIAFEYQDPQSSDLSKLSHELTKYTKSYEEEFMLIFYDLAERLEKEE